MPLERKIINVPVPWQELVQPGSEQNSVDHAGVNYFPNSKGGPVEGMQVPEPPLRISGDANRYDRNAGNDDYTLKQVICSEL